MTFEILAHADQPLAGPNEDPQALRSFAADMDLSEPTRSLSVVKSRMFGSVSSGSVVLYEVREYPAS